MPDPLQEPLKEPRFCIALSTECDPAFDVKGASGCPAWPSRCPALPNITHRPVVSPVALSRDARWRYSTKRQRVEASQFVMCGSCLGREQKQFLPHSYTEKKQSIYNHFRRLLATTHFQDWLSRHGRQPKILNQKEENEEQIG